MARLDEMQDFPVTFTTCLHFTLPSIQLGHPGCLGKGRLQKGIPVEYPTWQDQLDDIYHNGIDGWKTTIKVTKDKYPKG